MASRLELQTLLEELLGSRNVYFQPPETVKLNYPAIVYSRDTIESEHANDSVYMQSLRYSVTVIDKNPDSELPFKFSQMPKCRHDRSFKSDNLNHHVFTLYF